MARLRWCPPGNQFGSSPADAPLASARTTVRISQFSYLPMHANSMTEDIACTVIYKQCQEHSAHLATHMPAHNIAACKSVSGKYLHDSEKWELETLNRVKAGCPLPAHVSADAPRLCRGGRASGAARP